jgi:hypothetical protein
MACASVSTVNPAAPHQEFVHMDDADGAGVLRRQRRGEADGDVARLGVVDGKQNSPEHGGDSPPCRPLATALHCFHQINTLVIP